MILSHDHRLIFLKSRKVAGTSFEIALSPCLGPRDVITPILPEDEAMRRASGGGGPQNYGYGWAELVARKDWPRISRAVRHRERPKKFFNHIGAKAVRHRVGETVWHEYLKVSIVRNPWDMVVSWFFWDRGREADLADLTAWAVARSGSFNMNRPVYEIDGEVVIDHFLRYEAFGPDIAALEARIPALAGLHARFAGIRAKGGIRKPASRDLAAIYADHPEVDALVREAFDHEIARFGYGPRRPLSQG